MTGFARIRKTVPEADLVFSVKSVNHRGLDVHFRMDPELDPYEDAIRRAIKRRIARGHLQVHVSLARSGTPPEGNLNRPLLQAYLRAFGQAAAEFGLSDKPDLNAALRLPGMFREEIGAALNGTMEQLLLQASQEALDALNSFREREGSEIACEMRGRCTTISELAGKMEQIRTQAVAAFHERLKERLKQVLAEAGVEPQRLLQEAALLADRSDISEELVRLKTHNAQVQDLLNTAGEVGKKLDFLLQEMNRETNTVLSKTSGLGDLGLTITGLALSARVEIDKLREQSLNLE